MPINLLFFCATMLIGLPTSYEDIKTGKIRNFWVIIGLMCAMTLYFIKSSSYPMQFSAILLNIIISFITAVVLWDFKFWSGGDAKLFSVFAILTPIEIYRKHYPFFPAFHLLYNTFIPATIYLFIISLLDFIENFKRGYMRSPLDSYKDYLRCIPIFAFIFFINNFYLKKIMLCFHVHNNILYFVLILFYRYIKKFFIEKPPFWAYSLGTLAFVLQLPYFLANPFPILKQLGMVILTSMIFIVFGELYKKIIDDHIARTKNKTLPFAIWLFLGVLISWFIY